MSLSSLLKAPPRINHDHVLTSAAGLECSSNLEYSAKIPRQRLTARAGREVTPILPVPEHAVNCSVAIAPRSSRPANRADHADFAPSAEVKTSVLTITNSSDSGARSPTRRCRQPLCSPSQCIAGDGLRMRFFRSRAIRIQVFDAESHVSSIGLRNGPPSQSRLEKQGSA